MNTNRRRVVYLSDAGWRGLRVAAAERGVTASGYLRELLGGGAVEAPVKRRTLWFSDPDWTAMQTAAQSRGTNVSALVRADVLHQEDGARSSTSPAEPDRRATAQAAARSAQATRDAILRKVNRRSV